MANSRHYKGAGSVQGDLEWRRLVITSVQVGGCNLEIEQLDVGIDTERKPAHKLAGAHIAEVTREKICRCARNKEKGQYK